MARSMARLFWEVADVATANSGADALALIEGGQRFELVLCDIMMPGMTGLDLFDRVRVVAPDAAKAFVFATGGIPEELEPRLLATGQRCLMKPCDGAELKQLVDPAKPR
jgi:CheY-like chemotaxis protein